MKDVLFLIVLGNPKLTGLPCINLPLLLGENEMPLGIQLVGNYTADEKLIYAAIWLLNFIKKENQICLATFQRISFLSTHCLSVI